MAKKYKKKATKKTKKTKAPKVEFEVVGKRKKEKKEKKEKENKRLRKKKPVVKVREKTVKKKKPSSPYFFFIIAFLLLIFTFVSFLGFLLFQNYKTWEESFLSSDLEFLDFKDEVVDLDEKITRYNQEGVEYSFIEFSKREALFLLSKGLDDSLPDWFEVEKTALETSSGMWSFFVKTSVWNFELPWFEILLMKDQAQSVDIYIDDIFIGNFSFKNSFLSSTVEKANEGLKRGVRLVNDGNFAGRVFENIELHFDVLVIKSRNISF